MFLLSVAISIVISGLVVSLFQPLGLSDSFVSNFLSYSTLFGACVLIMGLFGRVFHWYIPTFRPQPQRLNLPLIVLTMVTIEAIGVVAEPIIALVPDVMMDELYGALQGGFWPMITVVLMAPILEEFLFRGMLQNNLSRFVGPFWGMLVASLIFGAIHIIPQQALGAFFVSLALAAVYEMTKSLSTVIIIHLLNNGLAYLFFLVFGEGSNSLLDLLGASQTLYWTVYVVSALYLVGISYWAANKIIKMNAKPKKGAELRTL